MTVRPTEAMIEAGIRAIYQTKGPFSNKPGKSARLQLDEAQVVACYRAMQAVRPTAELGDLEGLDKAAEEYAYNPDAPLSRSGINGETSVDPEEAFKAGARWQTASLLVRERVEAKDAALEWIRKIAEVEFDQDGKLRSRGARVLKRIADKAHAALEPPSTSEEKE